MRCLGLAGSRKKLRHSLRSFGAPIPTEQQYHIKHHESTMFWESRRLKCTKWPVYRPMGEHLSCSIENMQSRALSLKHGNRSTSEHQGVKVAGRVCFRPTCGVAVLKINLSRVPRP